MSEFPVVNELTSREEDAGAAAVDRIQKRSAAYRAKILLFKVLGLIALLVILAIAGIAYYGYVTSIHGRFTDTRPCIWKVGELEVTGTRSYSYPYIQVFGLRNIDTSKIEERTSLNINGNGISIIGLNQTDYWATTVKEGERGTQILKPSETYVFQIGKNLGVVKYGEFCK